MRTRTCRARNSPLAARSQHLLTINEMDTLVTSALRSFV